MVRAAEIGVALTFVIVLSYGLVSLKDNSVYTVNTTGRSGVTDRISLTATAADAFNRIIENLEKVINPQINYVRTK